MVGMPGSVTPAVRSRAPARPSGERADAPTIVSVYGNCGEEYLDETTTAELLKTADAAAQAGVQVDVRDYVAA